MGVNVQRGFRRNVSDHRGQCFYVHAVFQCHGRECVTKIVETKHRQFRTAQEQFQFVVRRCGIHRFLRLVQVREDPLGQRVLFSFSQQICHAGRQEDRSLTGVRLGFADLYTAAFLLSHRPADFQSTADRIEVRPFQAADFAAPHSGHQLGVEEIVPVRLGFDGFYKDFKLPVVQNLLLKVVVLQYCRAVRRIFRDQPFPQCRFHGLVKHHVNAPDCTVRQLFPVNRMRALSPFPLDFVVEFLYIRRGQERKLLVPEVRIHIIFSH